MYLGVSSALHIMSCRSASRQCLIWPKGLLWGFWSCISKREVRSEFYVPNGQFWLHFSKTDLRDNGDYDNHAAGKSPLWRPMAIAELWVVPFLRHTHRSGRPIPHLNQVDSTQHLRQCDFGLRSRCHGPMPPVCCV